MKVGREYISKLDRAWLILPDALEKFITDCAAAEIVGDPEARAGKAEDKAKPIRQDVNGTAVISISGTLVNTVPEWMKWFGIEATGYDQITRAVTEAAQDESVKQIVLKIASPGGMVAGIGEAAGAIKYAAAAKPTFSHISQVGASGAYWLASQAREVSAEDLAHVGSIGVYQVLYDTSAAAEAEGVKVIVVKAGQHKGTGIDGAPITEEQLAVAQENIDAIAEKFKAAVGDGRRMERDQVSQVATGRTWLAGQAKEVGLVDRVENFNAAMVAAETYLLRKAQMAKEHDEAIAKAVTETKAAEQKRLADLQAEFSDDLQFALQMYTEGKTLVEAKAAYCDVLKLRAKELAEKAKAEDEANAKLEAEEKAKAEEAAAAEAAKKATAAKGAAPMPHSEPSKATGDDLIKIAREIANEKKISIREAMREAHAARPDLVEKIKTNMKEKE